MIVVRADKRSGRPFYFLRGEIPLRIRDCLDSMEQIPCSINSDIQSVGDLWKGVLRRWPDLEGSYIHHGWQAASASVMNNEPVNAVECALGVLFGTDDYSLVRLFVIADG